MIRNLIFDFGKVLVDYDFAPAECLFTDDKQKNIDGALRAGLDAVLFTGAEAYESALRQKFGPRSFTELERCMNGDTYNCHAPVFIDRKARAAARRTHPRPTSRFCNNLAV